jgi:hypothetical protein
VGAIELRYDAQMITTGKIVSFMEFRSSFKSWDDLFAEAAAFATTLGAERLISISHSEDSGKGVVAVWYWNDSKDDPDVR